MTIVTKVIRKDNHEIYISEDGRMFLYRPAKGQSMSFSNKAVIETNYGPMLRLSNFALAKCMRELAQKKQ